jgi:hypothetical protein
VGGHEAVDIEGIEAVEQHLPDGRHDGGAEHHFRLTSRRPVPELARGHAPGEGGGEHRFPPGDRLPIVELRELREAPGLGDHHPHDLAPLSVDEFAIDRRDDRPHERLHAARRRLAQVLHPVEDRPDGLAHHGLEEGVLVGEIEVDRPLADAGPARDVVELRRGEALLGELGQRRADDLRRTVLLPAAPLRCRDGRMLHVGHGFPVPRGPDRFVAPRSRAAPRCAAAAAR